MTFLSNEDGTAFGIVVLAALLLVGTVVVLAMTPAVNEFVEVFNKQVDAGDVSTQRADAMAWNITMFSTAYIWLLLGGVAWAVVRALEHREGV
jgi:predicted DNA repair protein MutK